MKTTACIIAAVAFGMSAMSISVASAATDPARGVSVTAITVAADYARSHTVYAVAQLPDCRTDCSELLRSRDGGGSWTRARAQSWQPGGLTSVPYRGGAALVAWRQNAVAMSLDGGDSFRVVAVNGTPSDPAADGEGIDVLVSDGTRTSRVSLPQARAQSVTGAPDLTSAAISFTTAYPNPPAGVPAGIALGVDHTSGSARLERCDGALSCSSPVPVPTGGSIVSSPAFSHDLTFFMLGASELERSTDGGRSMVPITVMAPGPQTLITTATGLAFSSDFDAVTRRGTVYAGVISASKATHGGTLTGGVFRSSDAGTTWTRTGVATDLANGVSALAMAPDGRVFAGSYEFGNGAGGIYCDAGGAWSRTCPAYTVATSRTSAAGSAPAAGAPPQSAGGAAGDTAASRSTASTALPSQRTARAGVDATDSRRVTRVAGLGLLALVVAGGIGAWARRRRRRGAWPMD